MVKRMPIVAEFHQVKIDFSTGVGALRTRGMAIL